MQKCWTGCLQAGVSPAAHAASPGAADTVTQIMAEMTQHVEAVQPSGATRAEKSAHKQREHAEKLSASGSSTEQNSPGAPSHAPAAADAANGECHTSTQFDDQSDMAPTDSMCTEVIQAFQRLTYEQHVITLTLWSS